MRLSGAAAQPTFTPLNQLPGVFNDYAGSDRTRWRGNLPTYAGLRVTGLYPQITLDYAGDAGNLKSTYTVAPGGDPGRIRWRYTGAQEVRLAATGDLALTLPPIGGQPGRTITETAPIAWQEVGAGRVDVGVRFRLDADGEIRFALGSYDPALPLVIDPTLTTTALSNMTGAYGIDRDSAGNLYVSGCSTAGARLSQLTATGVAIRTTAFGYDSTSCGVDVAVAPDGRILVAGADALNAEMDTRAFVASWAAPTAEPVVTQLAIGSADADSVAFSPNQQGYVLWRDGNSSPTTASIAAITNGVPGSSVALGNHPAYGLAVDGTETLYTTRAAPGGNVLVKATLAGVSSVVAIPAVGWVGLDAANNVYVAGDIGTYPTSQIVVQSFTPAGQTRSSWASTVLSGETRLFNAALDPDGGVVLVGRTNADDFPRVGGTGVPRSNTMSSGFLLQLTPSGTTIAYSDILNATTTWNRGTELAAITIDAAGGMAIAGSVIDDSNEWVSGLLARAEPLISPPPVSPSFFMKSTKAQKAQSLGCTVRNRMEQKGGIVVLDYGSPRNLTASGGAIFTSVANPRFGTRLIGTTDGYMSLNDIKLVTTWFALGYQSSACALAGQVSMPPLVIVVGTTNSRLCDQDTCKCEYQDAQGEIHDDPNCAHPFSYVKNYVDNIALTHAHGVAWAGMVTDLNTVINGETIRFAGGIDAEFGTPDWADPGTMTWVTGYTSAATASLYNFGSCEDCPRTQPRSSWNETQRMALDRVYRLSWHLEWTKALPEIFLDPYKYEWYNVVRYGREFYPQDPPMIIPGVMTIVGDAPDLPPAEGWLALYGTFASNIAPDGSANTLKQKPQWLTQIREQLR